MTRVARGHTSVIRTLFILTNFLVGSWSLGLRPVTPRPYLQSDFLLGRSSNLLNQGSTVIRHSLIGADDAWPIYATMVGAAAVGNRAEKSALGRAISPPVTAMALSFCLSNIGVLPPGGSPHVAELQGVCVR